MAVADSRKQRLRRFSSFFLSFSLSFSKDHQRYRKRYIEACEGFQSRQLSITNFVSSFNFASCQQHVNFKMSQDEQQVLIQALVDRLVTAVDEQDCLFTLFWLNEARERNLLNRVIDAKRTFSYHF